MKKVNSILLANSNTYLIKGKKGYLLIDTGFPNTVKTFLNALEKKSINLQDIVLIVITHFHYDHVGNLKEIKDFTGAKIIVSSNEYILLKNGIISIPKGTNISGKLISYLGNLSPKAIRYLPVEADIRISETYSLENFGFNASIIPTPGHTKGSLSVLFDSGEAFVGDTCFNILLINKFTVFPPFANDIPILLKSWKLLLDMKVQELFPGHGKSFDREKLQKSFTKLKKLFENKGTVLCFIL